jgi:hypothetical protein
MEDSTMITTLYQSLCSETTDENLKFLWKQSVNTVSNALGPEVFEQIVVFNGCTNQIVAMERRRKEIIQSGVLFFRNTLKKENVTYKEIRNSFSHKSGDPLKQLFCLTGDFKFHEKLCFYYLSRDQDDEDAKKFKEHLFPGKNPKEIQAEKTKIVKRIGSRVDTRLTNYFLRIVDITNPEDAESTRQELKEKNQKKRKTNPKKTETLSMDTTTSSSSDHSATSPSSFLEKNSPAVLQEISSVPAIESPSMSMSNDNNLAEEEAEKREQEEELLSDELETMENNVEDDENEESMSMEESKEAENVVEGVGPELTTEERNEVNLSSSSIVSSQSFVGNTERSVVPLSQQPMEIVQHTEMNYGGFEGKLMDHFQSLSDFQQLLQPTHDLVDAETVVLHQSPVSSRLSENSPSFPLQESSSLLFSGSIEASTATSATTSTTTIVSTSTSMNTNSSTFPLSPQPANSVPAFPISSSSPSNPTGKLPAMNTPHSPKSITVPLSISNDVVGQENQPEDVLLGEGVSLFGDTLDDDNIVPLDHEQEEEDEEEKEGGNVEMNEETLYFFPDTLIPSTSSSYGRQLTKQNKKTCPKPPVSCSAVVKKNQNKKGRKRKHVSTRKENSENHDDEDEDEDEVDETQNKKKKGRTMTSTTRKSFAEDIKRDMTKNNIFLPPVTDTDEPEQPEQPEQQQSQESFPKVEKVMEEARIAKEKAESYMNEKLVEILSNLALTSNYSAYYLNNDIISDKPDIATMNNNRYLISNEALDKSLVYDFDQVLQQKLKLQLPPPVGTLQMTEGQEQLKVNLFPKPSITSKPFGETLIKEHKNSRSYLFNSTDVTPESTQDQQNILNCLQSVFPPESTTKEMKKHFDESVAETDSVVSLRAKGSIVRLHREDFLSLKRDQAIHREVVDAFFELLTKEDEMKNVNLPNLPLTVNVTSPKLNLFANSSFFDKLFQNGGEYHYSNRCKFVSSSFTKRINIFQDVDKIFIPICHGWNEHWTLIVIDMSVQEIHYCNSGASLSSDDYKAKISYVYPLLVTR